MWKCLHWLLNCYRSEMILASGKHTPAPPKLHLLSKFFKIRQEDCNRILKLKCNPGRIWSAASLWSRRAFRCVGVTGFGDQTLPRSQYYCWCGHDRSCMTTVLIIALKDIQFLNLKLRKYAFTNYYIYISIVILNDRCMRVYV